MDENVTLEELRKLPLSEAIALLNPNPVYARTARHGAFGNLGFRPMTFNKAGDSVRLHCHNFDHNIFIFKGTFLVWGRKVEGIDEPDVTLEDNGHLMHGENVEWKFVGEPKETVLKAPSLGLIRADWAHTFTCIEGPGEAVCAFAVRNTDGEVVTRMEQWDGNTHFMGQ